MRCSARTDCEHLYAAGCDWLTEYSAALPSIEALAVALGGATPKSKKSFREQWTPLVQEKLGRPLVEAEAHSLGRLSSLFALFRSGYGQITTYQMEQQGFRYSDQAVSGPYRQLFEGWWDPAQPPADAWALWQYIAYDWERAGWEIPDVFRPMTDTTHVRAALEERLLQREPVEWHHAFRTQSLDPGARRATTSEAAKITDLRLRAIFEAKGNQGFFVEVRLVANKPWKAPTQKWLSSLHEAGPADFNHLPAAAAALASALASALAAECDRYSRSVLPKYPLPDNIFARILAHPATHPAIFLGEGSPWRVEEGRITLEALVSPQQSDRLDLRFVAPDGGSAEGARLLMSQPEFLYEFQGRVYRGPPTLPARKLPVKALSDPAIMTRFRAIGLRLPESMEIKVRHVPLRPVLRCWLQENAAYNHGYGYQSAATFYVQLLARSDEPKCEQHWSGYNGLGVE